MTELDRVGPLRDELELRPAVADSVAVPDSVVDFVLERSAVLEMDTDVVVELERESK